MDAHAATLTATMAVSPARPSHDGVVRLLPSAMTDATLVAALRAHERGAAELLFDRYGSYVERLVVRVVGMDSEVPDLINEAFARALESIPSLRNSSALKGWVGSIALFTARTFLRNRRSRRRWLQPQSLDELPEAAAVVALPEVSLALARTYAVLDALPTDERIAFALRCVDGMELAEIADIAGVSLSTIKRRIARAQVLFGDAARRDPLLRELLTEGDAVAEDLAERERSKRR